MKYADKLKDPRWQKRRLQILENSNWSCEDCGETKKQLQVHHTVYAHDMEPWEYSDDCLMTLCDSCHKRRGPIEKSLRYQWGIITRHSSIERVESFLGDLMRSTSNHLGHGAKIRHE